MLANIQNKRSRTVSSSRHISVALIFAVMPCRAAQRGPPLSSIPPQPRSSAATSECPFRSATSRADMPAWLVRCRSAPAASSTQVMSALPLRALTCRGVSAAGAAGVAGGRAGDGTCMGRRWGLAAGCRLSGSSTHVNSEPVCGDTQPAGFGTRLAGCTAQAAPSHVRRHASWVQRKKSACYRTGRTSVLVSGVHCPPAARQHHLGHQARRGGAGKVHLHAYALGTGALEVRDGHRGRSFGEAAATGQAPPAVLPMTEHNAT